VKIFVIREIKWESMFVQGKYGLRCFNY